MSIVFTAGPLLHICAWTLLYMVHWGARAMCCAWLELDKPPAYQYTSGADLLGDSYVIAQSDKAICYV